MKQLKVGGGQSLPPTSAVPESLSIDQDSNVTYDQRVWHFFRCRKAASALEYAIVLGVVIAGLGAATLAFVGDISTTMESMGIAAGSVEIAGNDTDNGG